jgi:hypothetical protein
MGIKKHSSEDLKVAGQKSSTENHMEKLGNGTLEAVGLFNYDVMVRHYLCLPGS